MSPSVFELVNITAGVVEYLGSRKLLQYEVTDIKMISRSSNYLEVEFTLKRIYNFYVATTYLPSICLIIAAEITLFIDETQLYLEGLARGQTN